MKININVICRYFLFLVTLLLVSCTTSPALKFQLKAQKLNFTESTLKTDQFELTYFTNQSLANISNATRLHIYLGGDGTPWITPNHISIDPTPRTTTALNLMSLDSSPAIYIGRPCYHITTTDQQCDSKWWTSHRYSIDVISAIAQVINKLTNKHQQITLIGFSGGGAIAMLVAPHINNINQIITISGNLDTDHWAQSHNYTPLYGSLNPANYLNSNNHIKQLHLLGGADKNIDSAHLENMLANHTSAKVEIQPSYSHSCCWDKIWPSVLTEIQYIPQSKY